MGNEKMTGEPVTCMELEAWVEFFHLIGVSKWRKYEWGTHGLDVPLRQ